MMDAPDARRRVGIALLASALIMIVLAALMFAGVVSVGEDARLVVSAALVAAALVDIVIAVVFITRHAG